MDSVKDNLRANMGCEDLMACLYDLTETDIQVFDVLSEEKMDIDTIAAIVERDRGTVFRSLKRLRNYGFVNRKQVNYSSGGYYHVYYLRKPKLKAKEMQAELNEFYSKLNCLIDRFEEEYSTNNG